jgi:hypothetical protein
LPAGAAYPFDVVEFCFGHAPEDFANYGDFKACFFFAGFLHCLEPVNLFVQGYFAYVRYVFACITENGAQFI